MQIRIAIYYELPVLMFTALMYGTG